MSLKSLWLRKCELSKYDKTVFEHIRTNLLWNVGLEKMPSLEELKKTEWSDEFEALMRARLIMGAMRHRPMNRPTAPYDFDYIAGAIKRLELYQKTGNTECLVDAANLALFEFERGVHPTKHFRATDDEIHTQRKK